MNLISVAECAAKWDVAERTVRNYCAHDRIPGAVLKGKTWWIPEDAERPERINKAAGGTENAAARRHLS